MSLRYRYRAWDETQAVEPLPPERLLSALTNELLSGNIEQALDRALHRGVEDDAGSSLTGLDQLREQLRAARRAAEQAIGETELLRQLAELGMAGDSGGNAALEPESNLLLQALAAHPDAAQPLLRHVPSEMRAAIETTVDRLRGSLPLGSDTGEPIEFPAHLAQPLQRAERIDALERSMRRVRTVADVGEIDAQQLRELLGEDASERYRTLAQSLRAFIDSGHLRGHGGKLELSARALQHIGDELFSAALSRIASRQGGDRRSLGVGSHDLTGSSRDYQFGDPLALDLSRTVLQAVRRGGGVPVQMQARDFTVFERDDSSRAVTVLAIDLSRSMGERGYLLAAKKLALALATLVRTRYPRDQFLLTGFSESARPLRLDELPRMSWDRFGFGTNIQDALRLSRALLASHRGSLRAVILLTDGEPTAHREPDGSVRFNHPPSQATLSATYAEADRLRRDGIELCVCVLSSQLQVVRFAEQLARQAAGDLIVTDPEDLAAATLLRFGQRRR